MRAEGLTNPAVCIIMKERDAKEEAQVYTQQDLAAIRAQLARRRGVMAVPAVLFMGLIVYSVIIRLEWLTAAATIALGVLAIFGYDVLLKPLHCYERHVNDALAGRNHETTGAFDSLSPDISVVDGVRYYAMTLIQRDEAGDPFERMLYYDAEKPLPALAKGTPLKVRFHDRSITDWSVLT